MKHCPVCRNQYDDITLSFCLEDGTPLVVEKKQSTIDTISFNVPVTSGKIAESEDWDFEAFDKSLSDDVQNRQSHVWQTLENLPPKERVTQAFIAPKEANIQIPQPKTFNKIWFAVLPVFFVLAGGAGFFFYQEERKVENLNFTSSPKTEEKARNLSENSNMQTAVEPQAADSEKVKSEVTEFVNDWKKSAESRNLADFLGKYAAQVKYFEKENATFADVRGDVQKTFAEFEEIEISISGLKIAATEDGNRATAVFDKEWFFEGKEKIEEGKTHTKLELEKDEGKWKIIGERNLKVYLAEK